MLLDLKKIHLIIILAACRRESDILGANCATGLKRPLIRAKQA
jgi:hypothetical protein